MYQVESIIIVKQRPKNKRKRFSFDFQFCIYTPNFLSSIHLPAFYYMRSTILKEESVTGLTAVKISKNTLQLLELRFGSNDKTR